MQFRHSPTFVPLTGLLPADRLGAWPAIRPSLVNEWKSATVPGTSFYQLWERWWQTLANRFTWKSTSSSTAIRKRCASRSRTHTSSAWPKFQRHIKQAPEQQRRILKRFPRRNRRRRINSLPIGFPLGSVVPGFRFSLKPPAGHIQPLGRRVG